MGIGAHVERYRDFKHVKARPGEITTLFNMCNMCTMLNMFTC